VKLGRVVLIGLGAIVALLVGVGVYISHLEGKAEQAFGPLRALCEGKSLPAGSARPDSGKRLFAAFSRSYDKSWRPDVVLLPSELLAQRAVDAAHVVCLERETKTELDACLFKKGIGVRVLGVKVAGISTGDIERYPRVQHAVPVRVFSAQTGETVVTGSIEAAPPRACDRYVGKPSASDFDGKSVGSEEIGQWLGKNVPR
jgi:hypothetical protein